MNEWIQGAAGSIEKITLELLAWLRVGDHRPLAIALVVCGLALVFAMGVMFRWLGDKQRARRAAARNSQRITARRYHEKVWGWH